MKDKLSQEDVLKWIDKRIKSLSTSLETSKNFGWYDKVAAIEQVLSFWKRIKSLLTPVPEEKLFELIDVYELLLRGSIESPAQRRMHLRKLLKAYDNLCEGKEG